MATGKSILGVLISMCGSFLSALGMVLQKYAYLKRDKKFENGKKEREAFIKDNPNEEAPKEVKEQNILKSCIWIVGMVTMISSSFLDFFSYGLAPSSLLAPMGSLTLVFNTLLAWKFLHENLNKYDILATIIIITGAVISIVFGDRTSPDYNLDGLIALYDNKLTIAYLSILGIVLLTFMILIRIINVIFNHPLNHPKAIPILKTIHPILFAVTGGLFGGFTTLFTKSASAVVTGLFSKEFDAFLHFESYLLILAMVCSLFLQLKHLNGGLAKYEALLIVPIYQTLWMIATILSGAIYFQEISNFNTLQWVMFPIGIFITIIGLWLLSLNQNLKSNRKNRVQPEEIVNAETDQENGETNSQQNSSPDSQKEKRNLAELIMEKKSPNKMKDKDEKIMMFDSIDDINRKEEINEGNYIVIAKKKKSGCVIF